MKKTDTKPKSSHPFNSLLENPPAVLRGHALQVWKDTATDLQDAGIATRIEANALACYCQSVADFHAAQGEIDRLGLVVITERGAVKNPAVTIKNQAMDKILRFAIQFGLTPASRNRVTTSTQSADEIESERIRQSDPVGYAKYVAEHGRPPTNEFDML